MLTPGHDSKRARAVVAVMIAFALSASHARADTLELDAPTDCARPAAFSASVRQRTPLAHFEPGSGGRAFVVRVREAAAGKSASGSLVVTGVDRSTSSRDVDGESCLDVVDALSLIVALTIDPNARAVLTETPPSAPAVSMPVAHAPSLPSIARTPTPRRTGAPWTSRIGLEGVLGLGAAPSTTLGLGVDFGLTHQRARAVLAGTLSIHARASVEKTPFAAALPTADMIRAILVLSACPLALELGPVRTEACAGVAAGPVRFEGEGVPHPSAKLRFWSHVEPALQTTVALGRTTFLSLRASLEVPLVRDELVLVNPTLFVHRASPLGAGFGAGVGVRL